MPAPASGSFAKGVALVDEIGRLADALNHHPDVDLQYATVIVRLFTHDILGLSDLDAQLARQISAAARTREVEADAAAVQSVQLTIDALVTADVRPFWRAGGRLPAPRATRSTWQPRSAGTDAWSGLAGALVSSFVAVRVVRWGSWS